MNSAILWMLLTLTFSNYDFVTVVVGSTPSYRFMHTCALIKKYEEPLKLLILEFVIKIFNKLKQALLMPNILQ